MPLFDVSSFRPFKIATATAVEIPTDLQPTEAKRQTGPEISRKELFFPWFYPYDICIFVDPMALLTSWTRPRRISHNISNKISQQTQHVLSTTSKNHYISWNHQSIKTSVCFLHYILCSWSICNYNYTTLHNTTLHELHYTTLQLHYTTLH